MGSHISLESWLDARGLSHLFAELKANGVDLDVLADITSEELAEIGVSLGDRKRLLKALAEGTTAQAPVTASPQSSVPASAERRQITVLFCDLVGSTQLLGKLDPEESRAVIRNYRSVIAAEAERLGGHVAQYLGDGILVYFGWPTAFEDAAFRAVSAAIGMVQSATSIKMRGGAELAVRIGIATGLVVVGAGFERDAAEDMTAVGSAVTVAARLQELAKSGEIMVAQSTRQLVADRLAFSPQGLRTLKGIAEATEVFSVTTARVTETRGRQQFARAMLGRDEELNLALSRWNKAKAGAGQLLFITGEPGIGKSHLTERLVELIAADGGVLRRYVCSPFQQNKALHPVLEQLRVAIAPDLGMGAEAFSGRLQQWLTERKIDVASSLPFLLKLFSIEDANWPEPDETTPMIRKAKGFAAVLAAAQGEARDAPLLVVLEDAHWSDPTTLEFLELLINGTRALPVMIIVNARPIFRHAWPDNVQLTTLALQKIGRAEIESIIREECRKLSLPRATIDSIVERSDGIPLFVEELTKAVLESGSTFKNPAIEIPSSLRDTLMARLDRIPEAREVAQVAACIGRECDREMLAALTTMSGASFDKALSQLSSSEILLTHGVAPHSVYRFRHVLVQEAAADCLLKSKRRAIHLQIAQYMESRGEFAKLRPELLAHHFAQAEEYKSSIRYRQMAGEVAMAASGNLEAINAFAQALDTIELLPPSEERDGLELELLIAQAVPYTLTKGYAAPEVEAIYKRAMAASARLPKDIKNFAVIYGFWRFYLLRGDYANASDLDGQLMQLANGSSDVALQVTSNRAAGATRFYMARYPEALEHLSRTSSIAPDEALRKSILAYDVVDPWVVNTAYSGMALWLSGQPSAAIARNDDAIALAREVNHPFTLSLALCFAQWTHQFAGDRTRVQNLAEEALALSHKYGFTFWTGWAEMMLAWAESGEDKTITRKRMQAALQLWQSTGSQLGLSYFQCLLAEQCESVEAKRLLEATEKFSVDRNESFWLPEVYRMRGVLALPDQADMHFRHALATAEASNSRGLALKAATDLAQLHQGKADYRASIAILESHVAAFGAEENFHALQRARLLLTGA